MGAVLVGVKQGGRLVRVSSKDLGGRRPETCNTVMVGGELVRAGVNTPVKFANGHDFSYDPNSGLYVPAR